MSERSDRPVTEGPEASRVKQRRGFAAMSAELRQELSSRGGRASHAKGAGHEWTADSARAAGRKGGLAGRGAAKSSARRG